MAFIYPKEPGGDGSADAQGQGTGAKKRERETDQRRSIVCFEGHQEFPHWYHNGSQSPKKYKLKAVLLQKTQQSILKSDLVSV